MEIPLAIFFLPGYTATVALPSGLGNFHNNFWPNLETELLTPSVLVFLRRSNDGVIGSCHESRPLSMVMTVTTINAKDRPDIWRRHFKRLQTNQRRRNHIPYLTDLTLYMSRAAQMWQAQENRAKAKLQLT